MISLENNRGDSAITTLTSPSFCYARGPDRVSFIPVFPQFQQSARADDSSIFRLIQQFLNVFYGMFYEPSIILEITRTESSFYPSRKTGTLFSKQRRASVSGVPVI